MEHISLDVFDYNKKKLCSQYDSSLRAPGQAHHITQEDDISGVRTLSFELPYVIDKRKNFRWDYIKNELLIRLIVGEKADWFIARNPKKTNANKIISNKVSCDHISSILKTKNLYLVFDDENGIGEIPYLMNQILRGTGWKLGECDTIFERDGKTVKIRTLKSKGKEGAFKLITSVCTLFDAYPVFDGDKKTVNIYAMDHKRPLFEMTMGQDITSLSVSHKSDSIVTRLYVEGEYAENGYMGIDKINPTGLPYLMNFDYYKEIGVFTEEHEAALEKYYKDVGEANSSIKSVASQIGQKENDLNKLWGQIDCILYEVNNGLLGNYITQGEVDPADLEIVEGNELTILQADGTYRIVDVVKDGAFDLYTTDIYVVRFITLPSGSIGAKQVSIEAKQQSIKNLEEEITKTDSVDIKNKLQASIDELRQEIQLIYVGTPEELETETPAITGLYALMFEAVALVFEIHQMEELREKALIQQDAAETEFALAMGDMLREGYWNNQSYALGQEDLLYADAVDMAKEMAYPEVTYTLSTIPQMKQFRKYSFDLEINSNVRVYDPELTVNDILYISKLSRCFDFPQDDKVTLTNDDIRISGLTLDSILTRMAKLADQIDQKNSLYERSNAISPSGSIYVERLEGQINVQKTQLSSAVSSWYTDNNGNIIFESVNGKSAMMLCGDGFMIAHGKKNGEWNWRTFGTGEGFTADAITTGFLSAARIEAGAITADKLSANVGESLNLESNKSITSTVENIVRNYDYAGDEPPEDPSEGMLWVDTSRIPPVLCRWDGYSWTKVSYAGENLDEKVSMLVSQIEQNSNRISQYVGSQKELSDKVVSMESTVQQTSEDYSMRFTKLEDRIDKDENALTQYEKQVESYIQFNDEGMSLGKSDSNIKASLENDKLAFLQNNTEVAYVSDHKLYIPEANILDRISIGNMSNGYFDLITTPTGQAIKWRK